MVWLSLLVLMVLVAATPGIFLYVEHRQGMTNELPGSAAVVEPFVETLAETK